VLGGFLLGLWNLWRALTLLRQLPLLLELEPYLDPRVRLLVAFIWGLWFLLLAGALWLRRPPVRWLFPLSFFLYMIYHLSLLVLFMPAPAASQGWPAALALYLGALLWSVWVLYWPAHAAYWRGRVETSKSVD
jgi:hypothetical protein